MAHLGRRQEMPPAAPQSCKFVAECGGFELLSLSQHSHWLTWRRDLKRSYWPVSSFLTIGYRVQRTI